MFLTIESDPPLSFDLSTVKIQKIVFVFYSSESLLMYAYGRAERIDCTDVGR